MITIQEQELTQTDLKILELYSDGLNYRSIQRELYKYTGERFDKRELGERMGDIKKKMECQTQFQMGVKYAHKHYSDLIDKIRANAEVEQEYIAYEKYEIGKRAGFEQGKIQTMANTNYRGAIAGITSATVFWLIMGLYIYYLYFANSI